MPKAYWVSAYRAVKDPEKLAAYAKLAGPALTAGGGRFLARGEPAKVYERGLKPPTRLRWPLWATVQNGKSASSKASELFAGIGAGRAIRQLDPLTVCSSGAWLSPKGR